MKVKKFGISNPIVRLGLLCNEHCLFCNVPPESNEISGESYAKKSIMNLSPGTCVSISGGEPSLYSSLPDILYLARQRGIRTEIQTNAVLLADMKKVQALTEAGLNQAFVSLHSHISQIHDFLTGLKGSWVKSVMGIKNLLVSGIDVNINAVITTVNYSSISDFIIFLSRRLKIKTLSLSIVQPRNRAFKNKILVPKYSVLDEPVRRALTIAQEEGVRLINPICGLPMCIGGWENSPELCMEYMQGKQGQCFVAGKIHPQCCEKCKAIKYCAGVWKEYLYIHGASSLKPFKTFP